MNPVAVLRLPLQTDLSGFVELLRRLNVPHRVSEEAGQQVLWVPDAPKLADDVRQLYEKYPEGDPAAQLPPGREVVAVSRSSRLVQVRSSPVTSIVLLLCLIVAGVTWLGDDFDALRWLTFNDFSISGQYAHFVPVQETLAAGQWWRIVTPMFIHFGLLHLVMNALWIWELGRRIEMRQGSWQFLGLMLAFSAFSNYAQYFWSGPSLFGGLSGVLYALLGHCWLFQWLAPNPIYRLPRGVLIMMLGWLVLCMSGLISLLGFGEIANGAHVGGLIVGCATGLVGGALARRNH